MINLYKVGIYDDDLAEYVSLEKYGGTNAEARRSIIENYVFKMELALYKERVKLRTEMFDRFC